jgi:glycosyltransferase involved in cell wall biosynthesis
MRLKPRVAVISPFLDKRHGTERCVAEQVERLADDFELHLYTSAVEGVDLSKITSHHIPRLRGPHLVRYTWFFVANHVSRWLDRHFRKLEFDLVFSPGINCMDANLIAVHIVFAEFCRLAKPELSLRGNPIRSWPLLIHRRLSYGLFIKLERKLYTRGELPLVVISRKMASDLARCFNRRENISLVYHGVDLDRLNPTRRRALRREVRENLQIPETAFALLLIGNDWRKKGLPCLAEAVARLPGEDLRILLRGTDQSSFWWDFIRGHGLEDRTILLPSVPDVERHYAAADMYVGPSLEDSFAIPPLEAMACGLPVAVSGQAGASEIITHGLDGFILNDPRNSQELANLIHRMVTDSELRDLIGSRAAETARKYTWQRNAEEMKRIFEEQLTEKRQNKRAGRAVTAEV